MAEILIFEDDIHAQRILGVIMEGRGYKYKAFYEGEEGLEALSQEHFSLVLADMNLPDMDGIELIQKIRVINSDIPIIAISAGKQFDRGDKSQLDQAKELGAHHVFQKPFEHDELLRAIEQELSAAPSEN